MRTLAACLALALIAGHAPAIAMPVGTEPDKADLKDAVKAIDRKDYTEAVKLLTAVVQDDPRNADAFNYLGFSVRMQGKVEDSIRYYQRALAIVPNHRGANEYLGEAYLSLGDLPKAEVQLAALERICAKVCKEYKALAEAIATYRKDPKAARNKSS